MPDRSPLVPTPTIDRNGKRTTVYRRPPAAASSAAGALPPPAVAPPEAAPRPEGAYADRLAAIRDGNALWRAGEHPRLAEMQELVLRPEHMGTLFRALSRGDYARATKDLIERLDRALERQSYATLVAAARFARVYTALDKGAGLDPFDIDGIRALQRKEGRFQAGSVAEVIKVANQLQRYDLMAKYEAPEEGEVMRPGSRLLAHLWARARDSMYLRRPDSDQWLGLIDEFPEDVQYVVEKAKDNAPVDTVRDVLVGDVARPLAEGAL